MQPLRITFTLSTPICEPSAPIHLDALLAYCAVQEAQAAGTLTSFEEVLDKLPFDREVRDEGWTWKASALVPAGRRGVRQRFLSRKFWDPAYAELFGEGLLQIGRRGEPSVPTDLDSVVPREADGIEKQVLKTGADAGAIDTSRNHQKNFSYLYPVVSIPRFTAFCVGDKEVIEHLLRRHLVSLGKRARLDHGHIEHIAIECDRAAELLWEQRNTPWPVRSDDIVDVGAVRPPYWLTPTFTNIYRPRYPTADILEPGDTRVPA